MFKKWHDLLASSSDSSAPGSREPSKIEKLNKIIALYVDLLRRDPGLPVELLGEKWIGFEAYNIYKEIRSILLS